MEKVLKIILLPLWIILIPLSKIIDWYCKELSDNYELTEVEKLQKEVYKLRCEVNDLRFEFICKLSDETYEIKKLILNNSNETDKLIIENRQKFLDIMQQFVDTYFKLKS